MAIPFEQTANPPLPEHIVQFYETDRFLLSSISSFIATGLRAGNTCIVIATREHLEGLVQDLEANGADVLAAQARGTYIWRDASEVLLALMVDDMPDAERFTREVGSIIENAIKKQRPVRIFGEIVALLWSQGNQAGAIRLEELWNSVCDQLPISSLLCAYPLRDFNGHAQEAWFQEICRLHSQVIPGESFSTLSDEKERAQAVTLLQQKANTLEAEMSERKEMERLLHVSEEEHARLAAIVESSDDAIVSKTLEGIITTWNAAAERLFGYSAEEAVGKRITLVIPPELYQEEEEILRKLRQGIRIRHYETVRVRKDGKSVDVSLSISPVKDRSGKIIGAAKIARDISERRELERRKDEFISMASHELKTPVTALKGFTQLLQRRFKNHNDEESLRFLTRMDTQINKLTKHISEMLDISKMQSGQLEYHMERFDLDELVREIVENVQGTTQTHHLLLEEIASVFVLGDRDRIGQVLINLLTNAIKYSQDADRVLIRLEMREGNAIVSVQDFGIGISEPYQEKIFERFYQVTEPAEKTYPGLGIGLYIARQIVERHQGHLRVQSRKGEGATFSFEIPLAEQ